MENNNPDNNPRLNLKSKSLKTFNKDLIAGKPYITAIDISHNSISKLPDEIGKLINLKMLKAMGNELKSLPSAITKCTSLKLLDLGVNSLGEIPRDIFRIPSLETLDVSQNSLPRVPQDISFLQNLKVLSLSTNRISALPVEISQLSGTLSELDLSINDFTEVPECVCNLVNLTILNMSVNSITHISPQVHKLSTLRTLDLRNNKLGSLPNEIGGLTQLVYLSLQNNSLTELPSEIGELTMLRELFLDRNSVRALPESIVNLKNLRKLGLWKNDLRAIPAGVNRLESLSYLDLSDNKLRELPESFARLPALGLLFITNNELEELPKLPGTLFETHLTGNRITTLDPSALPAGMQKLELGQNAIETIFIRTFPEPYTSLPTMCQGLVELELPHNRLRTLPAVLGMCRGLRTLDISFNEFAEVPECVCSLESLTALNVSNNRLEQLPASFARLAALRAFNGNGNYFRRVPPPLLALTQLQDLSLAGNCLTTTPAALVKMRGLRKLDLSGNALLECVAVGHLAGLVELNVGHNRLHRLPSAMGSLQALQELCADGNSISHIPWTPAMLPNLKHVLLAQNAISLAATPSTALGPVPSLQQQFAAGGATLCQQQCSQGQGQGQGQQCSQGQGQGQASPSGGFTGAAGSAGSGGIGGHQGRRFRGNSVSLRAVSDRDLLNATLLRADTVGERVVYRVDGNPEIDRSQIAPSVRRQPAHRSNFGVKIAWSEMCGRRPDMQDALCAYRNFQGVSWQHLVGLFDGHAGAVTSCYVAKNFGPTLAAELRKNAPDEALFNTYQALQKDTDARGFKDGSTAVVVLICGSDIFVGNCGDSRAVLCRGGVAVDLTTDDKPSNPTEIARIRKLGGFITANGRVNGDLALSRSLGDCALQPFVTWEPKVTGFTLKDEDEFIVMGCDGIWDVMSSQKAVDIVRETIAEEESGNDSAPEGHVKAATRLRDCAYSMGSGDNLSAIVIRLIRNK